MIPRDYVTEWRSQAPWVEDAQVEQDLVICRSLIAIFSDPTLSQALAFRGGTASDAAEDRDQFPGTFFRLRVPGDEVRRFISLV